MESDMIVEWNGISLRFTTLEKKRGKKKTKTALAWMETEGENWKDENNRHIQLIKVTQQ